MKIIAIAGSSIPSDTANSIQVMKACSALVQNGHDLVLIVPDFADRNPGLDLREQYGIPASFPIKWLKASSRRLFTWSSVRRSLAYRPELLYVWMPQSAVFGLLARKPVVFEAHLQPTGMLGPLWHRAFAQLPGHKRLVCITKALHSVLEREFAMHLKAQQVVIAPNGVDFERFASQPDSKTVRRSLGWQETLTVLCAGHLYQGRGTDLFLNLAKAIPGAHFVWVGGRQSDVEAWRRKAAGITNLTFPGFVPNTELPQYLAAADVLLMPYAHTILGSSGEASSAAVASPMKMFEYMAAGRAILTSDLPVIREVLDDSSAVFVPPEDINTWTSALQSLLADQSTRDQLSSHARHLAENYTWTARAARIISGYPW